MRVRDDGLVRGFWEGEETAPLRDMPSPWPALEEHLHLRPGHLIGIAAEAGSGEALAGYDLAHHAATLDVRTLLYAPHLTSRTSMRSLDIEHRSDPHPAAVERVIDSLAPTPRSVELVVIDPFHLLHTGEHEGQIQDPDQAAEVGRQLKVLANKGPCKLAIVVMMHLTAQAPDQESLRLKHLGLGAELEYHADTLLLLRRTTPTSVDVLIAKDRYGPSPAKTTVTWSEGGLLGWSLSEEPPPVSGDLPWPEPESDPLSEGLLGPGVGPRDAADPVIHQRGCWQCGVPAGELCNKIPGGHRIRGAHATRYATLSRSQAEANQQALRLPCPHCDVGVGTMCRTTPQREGARPALRQLVHTERLQQP